MEFEGAQFGASFTEKESREIKKLKFSSHVTKKYENKCRLHEVSKRIDWEGPLGPRIG